MENHQNIDQKKKKSQLVQLLATLLCGCIYFLPTIIFGQDRTPQRGYQAGNSYSLSDIENVNLSNGNLILNIPLASLSGGRGGAPGYTVSLRYNSKLWDSKQERRTDGTTDENGSTNYMRELLHLSEQGGWKLDTGGHLLELVSRFNLEEQAQCTYGNGHEYRRNSYIYKLQMQMPDGSVKEFRPYGDGIPYMDVYEDGWFSINPNGLRTMWGHTDWFDGVATCSYSTEQITTAGMHYYTNDGSGIRLFIPYGQNIGAGYVSANWKMYYPDGRIIENRPPEDPTIGQKITDRNGNKLFWRGSTLENEVGQSITLSTDSNGDSKITQKGVNGEIIETIIKWKSYWVHKNYRATQSFNAPLAYQYHDAYESFSAVDKIILPAQAGELEYNFSYNAASAQPSSGNYTSGWGELNSVTLPSGAKADYSYQLDGNAIVLASFDVLSNSISQKELSYLKEYDGNSQLTSETTLYGIFPGAGIGTVTNPDGGLTFESSEYQGSLKGYPFRTVMPNGAIVEKIWAHNSAPRVGGSNSQSINAYVKTEFSTVPDAAGNPSLTAIKDFEYDKNGNVLSVIEYDWVAYNSIPRVGGGNFARPTGLPSSGLSIKRRTINTYYNATPNATDSNTDSPNHYANPGSPILKNLIKSTEIRDAANNPVSRSEFFYDGQQTLTGSPTNGNLTLTRTWDNFKGGVNQAYSNPLTTTNSVSASVVYDQYGNPTQTTDAKGVQTTVTYGSITTPTGTVTGLYPTQSETASNYSALKRTSTAVYDFYTGLVTSATDVDNDVTNATEYDALGRPVKTKAAVGTPLEIWSTTEYDDINRRVITRSDIETKGDGKKIAVQHYDQLGRVRLTRSIENAATEDPTNEDHGIKVQTRYQTGNPYSYQLTSNPYRAATSAAATNEESMGWTRSKSVNTGKQSEVETFTGSALPFPWGDNTASTGVVSTDINADRTLVTDQAGKRRISKTNALGQLINIWEIKESDSDTEAVTFATSAGSLSLHGLKTSYSYDTLNNLITVNQGVQTRSFAYNSLSRLKTADNPESGVINYKYDDNGNLTSKTDARGITTNYSYDALNRVTVRDYSDATPDVIYTYDNLTNAKGRLTKVTNGTLSGGAISNPFSITEYQQFDIMGRVKKSQQTTDGTAYNPMEYKYNLSGAMVEQKYPSGRVVKNVLDNDGDLSIVQSQRNQNAGLVAYAKHFTYTAAGAVSSMQYGNSKWESTQFNSRLQPVQIALGNVQNATDQLKLNFTYNTTNQNDNNGNVLSQMITVLTVGQTAGFTAVQTYTYDSLNRIKDAKEMIGTTEQWKQTFQYDRYGNRTFDEGGTSGAYLTTNLLRNCQASTANPNGICDKKKFNPAISATDNRLVLDQDADSQNDYLYDLAGNATKDADNRQFIYDAENKQIEVKDANNVSIGRYFYDGDGKRVKKISATETTIFVYDASGKMVAEYSTAVASQQDAKVSYLTNDHLGSPRITTDANGQVISRRDFQPFGEEIATSQRTQGIGYTEDTIRQKFTSYERDTETNLEFAQARYYKPQHGRFTSVDPLAASASTSDPQTFNRYVYVRNSPLVLTDPTGMIGDYYSDTGIWLGHDGINDQIVYFATLAQDRGSEVDLIESSIRETTIEEVLKAQDRAVQLTPGSSDSTSELVNAVADALPQKIATVGVAALTGVAVGTGVGGVMAATGTAAGTGITTLGLTQAATGVGTTVATAAAANPEKTAQVVEAAATKVDWVLGAFKSADKWAGQLQKRGWTGEQITEAIGKGRSFPAENLVNKMNGATRFVNPTTGQSVVIDNVTKEVLHVGGAGFKY